MNFVFWQNVVSIHQSAFIKALAEGHDVTLVAAERLDAQRVKEKWNVPDMGRAKVIVAPSDDDLMRQLSMPDTQHVFSGIDAYPMVYKAFRKAVKRRLPISVMAEPYEWAGVKGLLRRLKYASLFMRYGRHINHLFATGNMGVRCYRNSGFPQHKIHQWGYFTEQKEIDIPSRDNAVKPTIIFIGKIDSRKNILNLVDAAKKLADKFDKFLIIGAGPYEPQLAEKIYNEPKIQFIGAVPNSEIPSYLVNADLLVLPSLFDGWGAVVNEALAAGTRVLCSDRCGAEALLGGNRGGVFALEKHDDLAVQLRHWLEMGCLTKEQRAEISQWAKSHIDGGSASKYFCDAIVGNYKSAPWIYPPPIVNKC